jgi:hypothetical protein
MASDDDRIKELELEVERLEHELEKYRRASEDAMQQLGWCVGYFTGSNKGKLARSLAGNISQIRRNLLRRQDLEIPVSES